MIHKWLAAGCSKTWCHTFPLSWLLPATNNIIVAIVYCILVYRNTSVAAKYLVKYIIALPYSCIRSIDKNKSPPSIHIFIEMNVTYEECHWSFMKWIHNQLPLLHAVISKLELIKSVSFEETLKISEMAFRMVNKFLAMNFMWATFR